MAESNRLPVSQQDEAELRERQIATLLDEGLDRYFAARYEDAIHLWTRVLFLDRTHEKARAYIDRARKAMAELQRHSDELLQASRDLLERGDVEAARRLLVEAVATSADDMQAAALRVRLERVERVRALSEAGAGPSDAATPDRGWWTPGRRLVLGLSGALTVVIALVAVFLLGASERPEPANRVRGAAPATDQLPTLTSSEVALVRARTAMSRGRLSAALRELDRIGVDSADRPAADQLRIEIQQLLMASVRSSSVTTLTEPVRR
jgi:tetratricopeptide (TPR) repeat protein